MSIQQEYSLLVVHTEIQGLREEKLLLILMEEKERTVEVHFLEKTPQK